VFVENRGVVKMNKMGILEDAAGVMRGVVRGGGRKVVIPRSVGSQVDSPSTILRITEEATQQLLRKTGEHLDGNAGRFGSVDGVNWLLHLNMKTGKHDDAWIDASRGYWATSRSYFFLMPKYDEQFESRGFLKSFGEYFGVNINWFRPVDTANSYAKNEDYFMYYMGLL